MQDYDNQVKALGKSFDNYCRLCQEEEDKARQPTKKETERKPCKSF